MLDWLARPVAPFGVSHRAPVAGVAGASAVGVGP
jgi:hypothetical protein